MLPTALALHPDTAVPTARLHGVGGDFVMAVWETAAPGRSGRIVPSIDGAEAPRPYTLLTVPTGWGGERTIAVLRCPAGARTVDFRNESSRPVATAHPADRTEFDAALLMSGLDGGARLRVVRLLLDFCRSAFSLQNDGRFAQLCRRLILELSPNPATLTVRCAPTRQLALCDGGVSAAFGEIAATVVITPGGMRRLEVPPAVGAVPDKRGRLPLHLVMDRALCGAGTLVVLLGRTGLACRTVAEIPAELPTLLEWLERLKPCPQHLRDHVLRALALRAADEPQAAAAVRELQVLMPLPRRHVAAADRHVGGDIDVAVSTGDGGLFLAGWLHDPHGMVEQLRITSPFGDQRTLAALPHRFPREDVAAIYKSASPAGFAAWVPGAPDPAPALQYRCELLLRSGGRIEIVPPPRPLNPADVRAAVLGSMPPPFVTQAALETCIAPAVAPIHAAMTDDVPAPEVFRYGAPVADPAVSVVIPLYRNLEFLRFQIAAFAIDPAMATGAEIVLVLDSPEQRDELRHYLHGLHGLYALPLTLVVNAANHGYSTSNNAGAAVARGRHLLFLNSDVIPDRPGWLPKLVAALEASPDTGAVGPKLLFEDESLQHAGLFFGRDYRGRWINQHYHKGMPRDFAPACLPRAVPGVTGACLLMPADVFREVGGFTTDYIIGDYEDSDLCLKVRASGRAIRYVPAVELYHLERQSISRHAGYTRGVASEYNAWLHSGRWSGLMEDLMGRDWPADETSRSLGRSHGRPPARRRNRSRKTSAA
ncbi:glycosyltransferase [Skermanella mucosa]|uniref:glycosyltransferase n=1 Tax=Skermanella mucosa TaxID=1789672 RepID=UPI00192BEFE7|nr:glycosyltransferase [Skermanella mucosa]UEM22413.1 glycosyltransferase [Skermanella mucosa]